MVPRTTSVLLKATYNEKIEAWVADERQLFENESSSVSTKEVTQFELSIWSLMCLSVLVAITILFVSQ
jgi:hypothetical protein